jgi:hypothetical protein
MGGRVKSHVVRLMNYKAIISIVILGITHVYAQNYSLLELIDKSQNINLGYVTKVENKKNNFYDIATISVLHTIKGKCDKKEINLWSVPPNFHGCIDNLGRTVEKIFHKNNVELIFYNWGNNSSDETTPRLEGSLTIKMKEYAQYVKYIEQYISISQEKEEIKRNLLVIKWLINGLRNNKFRLYSLWELSSKSYSWGYTQDMISEKERDEWRHISKDYSKILTKTDKKEIKDIFFSKSEYDNKEIGFIDILIDDYPVEIRKYLDRIFLNQTFNYFESRAIMSRIYYLSGNSLLKELIMQLDSLGYYTVGNDDKHNKIISKYKSKLKSH